MTSIKYKSIAICLALSVAPFLNLAKAENVLNLERNDKISGEITFGDQTFPLPDGAWIVVLKENKEGNVKYNGGWQEIKFPVVNIVLAQKSGSSLKSLARYIGNVKKPSISVHSWNVDPCKLDSSAIYYRDSFHSRYEQPECLSLSPIYSFLGASGGYWQDIQNWLTEENILIPKSVVYINYSKYTRNQFVQASVWMNPELVGFEREKFNLSNQNGWYPANLDQKKKDYISGLVEWSKLFADNVRKSF